MAGDNYQFDFMAMVNRERRRHDARVWDMPSRIQFPRSDLWLCAEDDITPEFLDSLGGESLIVTCKDTRVPRVDRACELRGYRAPLLFNIGHTPSRERQWWDILPEIVRSFNAGQDVVMHCRAGRHRGAMATCFVVL